MKTTQTIERILDAAMEGKAPSRQECLELLGLPATSLEAAALRVTADAVSRNRFGNQGVLQAQIGLETAPCPGGCGFCVFGDGHCISERKSLSDEEILLRAREATADGDVRVLFLMTMHSFDLDRFLEIVRQVKIVIPSHTEVIANVGDFDLSQAQTMKACGVSGAYHVCRLREGEDNRLDPAVRKKTLHAIRQAGMDLYFCVEPIGPEHSNEELMDQMTIGFEYGCFQHAAMRRVAVPGTPLCARGQITELRQAQVVAVVALAALGCPEVKNIGVHEPNLLGLTAGANAISAETGANPRDTEFDTALNRGRNSSAGRVMLWEAGFTSLQCGDGTTVPLDLHVPAQ
jgi:biotin synthase